MPAHPALPDARPHPWLPGPPRPLWRAWAVVPGVMLGLVLGLSLLASPARADEFTELRALLARGEAATALPRLEKAAAAAPRDAQLRFLLGVALMDLQRDEAALAHFSSMAQDYPELPDPYNNIALLQARAGRLEAARQALETALRNDPSHRAARLNLGQVHLMLAVQAWELAAAEGPLDTALLRRLEMVRALLLNGPAAPPAVGR